MAGAEVLSGAAGGRHQPFYYVLVDMANRPNQMTYVAQENIIPLRVDAPCNVPAPRPINHPDVKPFTFHPSWLCWISYDLLGVCECSY